MIQMLVSKKLFLQTDFMDKEVVKKAKFKILNTKLNKLYQKILDATTLIQIYQYNTDKQNLEKKIRDVYKKLPDACDLDISTVLNTKISDVENKIPDTSGLVTTSVLNTKIGKFEKKVLDHARYITTQQFNKLAIENFAARLKQADLVRKTDFHNKLISFNRKLLQIK